MSSSLFSLMAQSSTGSDWNWFLIFISVVVVLALALVVQARFNTRNAEKLTSESHSEAEPHHAVPEVEPEPAVAIEPEEIPEPAAEAQPEPQEIAALEIQVQPDDLKKLEGIGPKVAGLLNQNGITTYAQLAETPVEKLREILEAAKLQMIHPDTWPQQAKLAALADWEALQKLQDGLKGGR